MINSVFMLAVVIVLIPQMSITAFGGVSYKVESNSYSGNCSEFLDYIDSSGVIDLDGNQQPEKFGVTNIKSLTHNSTIRKSSAPIQVREKKGNQFLCPCNNTYYSDIGVCNAHCRVTLGCFTNICAIAQTNAQVCVSGTVDFTAHINDITAELVVTTLDWAPTGGVSEKCKGAIERIHNKVIEHEMQHVEQMKKAIEETIKEFAGKKMTTIEIERCAEDEASAIQAFKQEIQDYTNSFSEHEIDKSVREKYKTMADQFDAAENFDINNYLDCKVCSTSSKDIDQ